LILQRLHPLTLIRLDRNYPINATLWVPLVEQELITLPKHLS